MADLHDLHEEMFAVADRDSHVEAVTWRARARCAIGRLADARAVEPAVDGESRWTRAAYFPGVGLVDAHVHRLQAMAGGERVDGPAIVESSFTTVVIDPGASVVRPAGGNLIVDVSG